MLLASIAKAPFFAPTTPKLPVPFRRGAYQCAPLPPQPAMDHAALAKRYVQTCVVLSTAALDAAQARKCVQEVMTPVVAACAERVRDVAESVRSEEFEGPREKAVRLVFEAFAGNAAHVRLADVTALIGARRADFDVPRRITVRRAAPRGHLRDPRGQNAARAREDGQHAPSPPLARAGRRRRSSQSQTSARVTTLAVAVHVGHIAAQAQRTVPMSLHVRAREAGFDVPQ
ncbi:hypothetical protein PsYK624_161750 [Phanerochaete sordida]|uniref:Uncharacterized protein n=1 Tax=Phanerochaete sordida TaxID=48140 RepID=A0A9P3GUX9_9APHY|nr:hypothetical protein PsYK624_161750 [Phanerochaete sordida]